MIQKRCARLALRRYRLVLLLLFPFLVILLAPTSQRSPVHKLPAASGPLAVTDVKPLGVVTIPTGTMFKDTEVGGLSGITYDAAEGVYYAVSDDGSRRAPARYYTIDIDLSNETLEDGDVTLLDVTFLRDQSGQTFAPRTIDPEGIEIVPSGQVFIASEGDVSVWPRLGPTVNRLFATGKVDKILPTPDKFIPDRRGFSGIRTNRSFESLTSKNAFHSPGCKN